MNKKKTLIALATAWGPKYGGINAFNYDLLIAIAHAHWSWLRVICIVSESSENEIQLALDQHQIELINLELNGGSITKEHSPLIFENLKSKEIFTSTEDLVFLGHDRITGAVAIELAKTCGFRSALIHHMSYAHYESYAEDSATSIIKEREQKNLLSEASICLAVGPLLQKSAADMLDLPITEIPMLIPGLADITPRKNQSTTFIAFVSGRLDIGAQKIKQAHLGVAGFAEAIQCCDKTIGLPDVLRGENEPRLILRGIELEKPPNKDSFDAETELKELAQQHAGRVITLQALPFTQDRAELFEDLKKASVCLMPSWHEGFGLVAWEAIAAGVPLIVSKKSGVYHFLKTLRKENLVRAIDVKGKSSSPFFNDEDKQAVANLLIEIAKNPSSVRLDALRLKEELQNDYRWKACADAFVGALDWHVSTATVTEPPSQTSSATTVQPIAHVLDQWLALPTQLWKQQSGLSASQLLKAEEEFIPFALERFQFLQMQLDWAKTQTYPTCVRLLTGEGGTGKTRLALEMCKRLFNDGWTTGFLRSDFQTRSAHNFAKELSQIKLPLFLVIDYAETRTSELLEFLAAVISQKGTAPIRILLLARSSGEWWGQLSTYDKRCEALLDGSATTGPYSLPALYEKIRERKKAFDQAITAFAAALNITPPYIQPDLSAKQYNSPLFLQMAALLNLLGEHTANAESLPQSLVRHEQRYWRKVSAKQTEQAIGSSNDSETSLFMSLVTLIGHAATAKAIQPIWAAADGQDANLKPLFTSLSQLYPGRQGLGALQPDLLGEALVGRQVLGSEGPALLNAVLGRKSSATQRTHALTILSRILRYRPDISTPLEAALSKHFAHCAQSLFQVCIQTPSPLSLVAERSFKQLSPAVALQVAGLLESNFKYEVLPLAGLELLIRETLNAQAAQRCQKARSSIEDKSKLSQTLNALSIANSRLGKNSIALAHAKQALDICQSLAKDKSERFESGFAMSLNNYANRLSVLGKTRLALDCAKQSLGIYQRLAKNKPERFEPDLAMCLSNYAGLLSEVGDTTQALDYSKQSLDIRKRLAKDKPERFESGLSMSLNNYANHLSDVGDTTLALNCAKQSLDICQRLAKDKPERFEPDLAMFLNNYASQLSDVGQTIQALDYAKQALDICQRLAKDKPERFELNLVMSLNNYANHLSAVGDTTLALNYIKRALDICQLLVKDDPQRFESNWAMSLYNYANHLSDDGNTIQALDFAKQSLVIYERLATANPAKFSATAHESKIFVALLAWLIDGKTLSSPSIQLLDNEVPYLLRPARFYQFFLRALSRQEPNEIAHSMDAVWCSWNAMSISQQIHWEAQYLVICAYAKANACLDASNSSWSEKLKIFKARRNGKLPQWMTQIAERKSFDIDIEHTN